MREFSITDPLPSGTVLLEASAGTGKTWTIAALVTRFVAEGKARLPQMLVVTFGRAASQELRARVREQLVAAERAFADPPAARVAPDELMALLLEGTEEELAQRRMRLRTALSEFDSATIATTHQFCQQVLRSLGTAGTTDASAELVEDLDDLLVEVVDDLYLRAFAQRDDPPFFSRSEALSLARTVVNDVHATPVPISAAPGSVPDRKVRFAHAVRDELDVRKQRLQVMHYNDLLTQLSDALKGEDSPARARMRQRWHVVLVDEFQDTDPVQWEVLERAFAGHARAMVLIGDPKQAIYAFRGGDIFTYLDAASSVDEHQTLPRNFRSDPGVVNSLQVLLGGAQLGEEQIVVHPVTAHHTSSRLRGAPHAAPVRVRQVLNAEHLGKNTTVGHVRPYIARDLAQDIAALLTSGATFEGKPLQARDVAVLAHKTKDLLEAQRALREVGIPAVSTGGSSVLQTRGGQDWLALLEAMVAPHRALLTRAAALTDLLGYPVDTLARAGEHDEREQDRLDDELAQVCRDLAATYARQGLAAVLEVLTTRGLPGRVLAQVGGERTLTDLRHVAQLLHEVARRDELGLVALLEWLRSGMAQDAPQSSGARTRRLDSDAAAVQLATIHGSKGLQYPVVYLPSLVDRFVSKTPGIPLFHDDSAGRRRCLDVGGDHDANPGWSDSVRAHKDEDAGESLRLLYVAMTRAQSQVVTWWAPMNNAANSGLHRLAFGREQGQGEVQANVAVPRRDEAATEVLSRWAAAGAFSLERADLAPEAAVVPTPELPQMSLGRWTRTVDSDWRRTSYSALSSPTATAPGVSSEPEVGLSARDDEPDSPDPVTETSPTLPGFDGALGAPIGSDLPSPMADLPVGATFGSLVHGVLEDADPQAGDLREEMLAHIAQQRVFWPVDLGEGGTETLADALVAVCDSPLGPLAGNATLREIGRPDRLCELDFELPLSGGDLRRRSPRPPLLGDLAPLLREQLPVGDSVRGWADVLDATPDLAQQQLRGYLTGSIDVVLRTGGHYLVVDYKTNWLGQADQPLTAADYLPERLDEAMGHSSYPLQALLYAVVAHRFLRWRLPDYDPRKHLGGVLYLYLRGMCGPDTPDVDGHPTGVFSWKPPVALVMGVSDLLDGDTASEVAS